MTHPDIPDAPYWHGPNGACMPAEFFVPWREKYPSEAAGWQPLFTAEQMVAAAGRDLLERAKADADGYGNALNAAGWEFHDAYFRAFGRGPDGWLFNAIKPLLRDSLRVFFETLERNK